MGLSAGYDVAVAKILSFSNMQVTCSTSTVLKLNKNTEKETTPQFFKPLHHVSKGSLKIKGTSQMHHLISKLSTGFKAQKARSCPTGS